MLSRIRSFHHGRTQDLGATLAIEIDRLDFRSAIVIEESAALRGSIIKLLKKRGWIAHGVRLAGQAFPLLKCIPYHLIVIDGEASNIAAINFVRTLNTSKEWNKIPLVIVTDLPTESLASNLKGAGVHSARRSTRVSDLTTILTGLEPHGRWQRQAYAN